MKGKKVTRLVVFADVENCYIPKYIEKIARFLKRYSQHPTLFAYHHWSNIDKNILQKMQQYHWLCINTGNQRKNWLDELLTKDCLRLCKDEMPDIDIVVLISCDHGYAKLIQELQNSGKKTIVIGRCGKVSKKLEKLTDCYYLEHLK
jgi:hypothetical protein